MTIPLHICPSISQSSSSLHSIFFILHAALVPADERLALRTLVGHGVERVDAAGYASAEREPETLT